MRKAGKKEYIYLKNNQNKIDSDFFNNQLLNKKSSSLRILFLKFKTQKTSPKRASYITIKNNLLKRDNNSNKKLIRDNKQIIKVISKNGSGFIRNKKKLSNNTSFEKHNIKFRNQLVQNNGYTPKSFEHIISKNLIKKDDDINNKTKININLEKYKKTNLLIIKKNNKKNDINNQEKKNKTKIKIIRANVSYHRNLKNKTLKDFITNYNSSNRSQTNCINRINSNKNYQRINLSSNHLKSIYNKEDFNNKLNNLKINIYKKLINQTTPVTLNISRKFSSSKKLSINQSFRFNKNRLSTKESKKSLILTRNNSKLLNKIQKKKSNFSTNNKNTKFIRTNNYDENKNKLLYNDEIKVLKPYKKKKKIIIINRNKNDISKYTYKNSNNISIKCNETKSTLSLKRGEKDISNYNNIKKIINENKELIRYKIKNMNKDKNYTNSIIDKNSIKNNAKKKISISNSKNNSKHKNQVNNTKTSINKKNIIQISEKQSSQKNKNRKLLIKDFINKKNNNIVNNIKKEEFINQIKKISKKSSERTLNIFPHIKKNFKDKKYTLTCNSRIITPKTKLVNNSFTNANSKNKTRIDDNSNKKKIIDIDINDKKHENINPNTIELIKDNNINNINNANQNICNYTNKSLYYSEESQKLSQYIKDYYNLSDEYPTSNLHFYKFGRIIGKGAFGKVNIGLHILTGRIVAIKSFNKTTFKDEKYRTKIMNEIELMKNLKHFSVVRILDVFETEKYILLVMENVLGGDLLTFIKKRTKLPEKTARFIFKQLLQSLKYIHSKNIVHRDIKLDNILIDLNNNIKLCDFGVGKYLANNNEILFDQCGTPAYIAPEVMSGEGYVGFPVDIWSSGVVLYSLLMGNIPFKAQNLNELQGLIMSGNFKQVNGISKEANDLLNKLLDINPKTRITIDDALNHPWISDNNNDSDDYKASLFTKAELILLSKNSVDYRNCSNEEIIENFTLQNLDTNKFNENKNNKTRSFIFAPFNTSFKSNEKENNSNIKSNDLENGVSIENNIILFDQDTNALNRQYELNNNIEIDHGVIINN
jgi:MAP/microtubule affinity-regulating kinase